MRTERLIKALWYEDATPGDWADELGITPEALFQKVFGHEDFTAAEIRRLSARFYAGKRLSAVSNPDAPPHPRQGAARWMLLIHRCREYPITKPVL